MELELYTGDVSPFAQMVEIQLSAKGIAYTRALPTREFTREGEFGEINPLRKIPTLVIDGTVVPETQVIFEMIEELFPSPRLLPVEPFARSRVRLLSRIADVYLAVPMVQLLNNKFDGGGDQVASHAISSIERGMRGLEHWLEPGRFADGNARSLADCTIPPAFFCMIETLPAFEIGGLPPLGAKAAAYYEAIRQDDFVAQCMDRARATLEQRTGKVAQQA